MSTTALLRVKDYRAIGGYAKVHNLRLALVDWPNKMIYFRDQRGEEVKVLLSHVHDEHERIKEIYRKKKHK
jgi:hypothetical protein